MGIMTQNKRMKTAKMSVRKGKGESRNVGTLVDASQYLVLEDHIRSLYGTPHARVCCLQVLRESVRTVRLKTRARYRKYQWKFECASQNCHVNLSYLR